MIDTQYLTDPEFETAVVKSVDKESDGWGITRADGWSFYVPAKHGVEPHPGDVARFYGRGIGYTVRGLALNDRLVFYRTEAEERAKFEQEMAESNERRRQEFEAKRADHDARISALPDVFQRRIRKFQTTSPDFRWKHEGYELMCCEQAVLFVETLKTDEAVAAFHAAPWEQKKIMIPGLDEGHSGNSFDFACRLARAYLRDPELVYLDHGTLTILVGCEQYGCPHPAATTQRGAGSSGDE